jgi:hypothetical protein
VVSGVVQRAAHAGPTLQAHGAFVLDLCRDRVVRLAAAVSGSRQPVEEFIPPGARHSLSLWMFGFQVSQNDGSPRQGRQGSGALHLEKAKPWAVAGQSIGSRSDWDAGSMFFLPCAGLTCEVCSLGNIQKTNDETCRSNLGCL